MRKATEMNDKTLVVVCCYAGDRHQVEMMMPYYRHHGCPVLVLSPDNSRVNLQVRDVTCKYGGWRAYTGQESLNRQIIHMRKMLESPYDFFLANDSDSLCLSAEIPPSLYAEPDVVWSNEVLDWRTHPSKYPKIAMQPPYFFSRASAEKMIAAFPKVITDPITPFIDWFMPALCFEANVLHKNFPMGCSFGTGDLNSQNLLEHCVRNEGKVMLHSVKTREALRRAEIGYRGRQGRLIIGSRVFEAR